MTDAAEKSRPGSERLFTLTRGRLFTRFARGFRSRLTGRFRLRFLNRRFGLRFVRSSHFSLHEMDGMISAR